MVEYIKPDVVYVKTGDVIYFPETGVRCQVRGITVTEFNPHLIDNLDQNWDRVRYAVFVPKVELDLETIT